MSKMRQVEKDRPSLCRLVRRSGTTSHYKDASEFNIDLAHEITPEEIRDNPYSIFYYANNGTDLVGYHSHNKDFEFMKGYYHGSF